MNRKPMRYRSSGLVDLGLQLSEPTPVFLPDGDKLDLLARNELFPMHGQVDGLPYYGLPESVPALSDLDRSPDSPTALWLAADGSPREIWIFEVGIIHRFRVELDRWWRFIPTGDIAYPEPLASKGLGTVHLIQSPDSPYPHFLLGGAHWRREVPVPTEWSPDLPFAQDLALRYGGTATSSRLATGCREWDAPQWQVRATEGFVYMAQNTGEQEPRYETLQQVKIGTEPILVCGKASPVWFTPYDEGGPHLMIADFQGNLLDFPAIDGGSDCGAPTMKALVEGRLRDDGRLTDGESPIELTGCMPRMTCCDLTGDGHQDLISILEDGHVYVSVNDGRHLSQPRLLQQERSIIKTGVLAVPAAVRNRAGKVDLYCGNASGHIMHLRNITDDAEPDLEPPRLLRSGGETFRVIAGPDGSPQGPVEYKWGYVAPTALDWTGDGVPDLLMGCITGAYWLLLGSKTDADLEWAEPRRITVDGQPFVGVWRVRPSVADWNADGQPEMLTLDEQGFLSLYGQQRAGSPEDLRSLGRVSNRNGGPYPITGKNGFAGHISIGRVKLLAYDWDGDGLLELLVGTHCQMKKPLDMAALFGAPEGSRGSATLMLIDNVGSPEKPVFGKASPVVLKDGSLLDFGAHSCAPVVVDWNEDGHHTIVVGNEDGFLYSFDKEELTLADTKS